MSRLTQVGVLSAMTCIAVAGDAHADMGGAAVIPAASAAFLQFLLMAGIFSIKSFRGSRVIVLAIYAASVILAWAINLRMPADDGWDFWIVFVLPLVTCVGLIAYYGRCRSTDEIT